MGGGVLRPLALLELAVRVGKGQWTMVERATGIEPAWPAWKAGALPLSYARMAPC